MSEETTQTQDQTVQDPQETLDLDEVIADIARVMEESGLEADQINITKYAKHGGKYDGRKLRRLGGFAAIVDEAFRQDKQADIYTTRIMSRKRSYVAKLERKMADWSALRESVGQSVYDALERLGPVSVSKLEKPPLPSQDKIERENGVLVSDNHLGLRIDNEEVKCNEYSWLIGARRLGKLAEQVASYKVDHRSECPQLRVLLGGDLGQGAIHLDDVGQDLMSYQCVGIAYYIIQMIDYWRHHYQKIVVECTPDNHLRFPHKGPDRQFAQKFDSWATIIHVMIQFAFRGLPDVEFHVPKSAITTFDMLGHKMALTHGDTHMHSGSVGKSVPVKSVCDQVLRLNANVRDSRMYKAIFMGHVHVPMYLHMPECDTALVVNGTSSGTDGYAHGIGFHTSSASQVIWETTRKHQIGDFRKIDLGDADVDTHFDAIIAEYKHGFEVNPMFGISYPGWFLNGDAKLNPWDMLQKK